jgi:hypothetical protein
VGTTGQFYGWCTIAAPASRLLVVHLLWSSRTAERWKLRRWRKQSTRDVKENWKGRGFSETGEKLRLGRCVMGTCAGWCCPCVSSTSFRQYIACHRSRSDD